MGLRKHQAKAVQRKKLVSPVKSSRAAPLILKKGKAAVRGGCGSQARRASATSGTSSSPHHSRQLFLFLVVLLHHMEKQELNQYPSSTNPNIILHPIHNKSNQQRNLFWLQQTLGQVQNHSSYSWVQSKAQSEAGLDWDQIQKSYEMLVTDMRGVSKTLGGWMRSILASSGNVVQDTSNWMSKQSSQVLRQISKSSSQVISVSLHSMDVATTLLKNQTQALWESLPGDTSSALHGINISNLFTSSQSTSSSPLTFWRNHPMPLPDRQLDFPQYLFPHNWKMSSEGQKSENDDVGTRRLPSWKQNLLPAPSPLEETSTKPPSKDQKKVIPLTDPTPRAQLRASVPLSSHESQETSRKGALLSLKPPTPPSLGLVGGNGASRFQAWVHRIQGANIYRHAAASHNHS